MPTTPVWAKAGVKLPIDSGTPNNQIPLQKVGEYWVFDAYTVTIQHMETIAVIKTFSEVIKWLKIGAAPFG